LAVLPLDLPEGVLSLELEAEPSLEVVVEDVLASPLLPPSPALAPSLPLAPSALEESPPEDLRA
jgi:hypothetical protein